jgi:NAD(P)-dependent dehydrogenase (short-subunit alcohol dehydrogenase family)
MTHQEKIAFVSGANRGLGFEVARGLGKLEITVVLGARDQAKGEQAVAELRKDGIDRVEAVVFDAQNRGDHQTLARMLDQKYGRLDILVNNAGVALEGVEFENPDGFNTVTTVSQEVLKETFDVNFFAVVGLTQTLLPLILRSRAGRIVNTTTVLASLTLQSDPAAPIYKMKSFAYDSSKTALNAFTVHLAAELQDTSIKVNSAHPGWVKTSIGGKGANLSPAEGSKTIVQMATLPEDGPTGAYIHLGQTLPW